MQNPPASSLPSEYRSRGPLLAKRVQVGLPSLAPQQSHANLVSVAGALLCATAAALLAASAPLVLVAVLFSVGAACDLVDGRIARAATSGSPSQAGAFIDSMCDKVGEGSLLVGVVVAFAGEAVSPLAVSAYVLGWLTSYAKAAAGEQQIAIDWLEVRVYGRAVRALLVSATLFLAFLFADQESLVFILGFSVLLMFNSATLVWRLRRVGRALATQRASH